MVVEESDVHRDGIAFVVPGYPVNVVTHAVHLRPQLSVDGDIRLGPKMRLGAPAAAHCASVKDGGRTTVCVRSTDFPSRQVARKFTKMPSARRSSMKSCSPWCASHWCLPILAMSWFIRCMYTMD